MSRLKSLFMALFIAASVAGSAFSLLRVVREGAGSPWLGALAACSAPVLFLARMYLRPVARTSPNLPLMLGLGVAGTVLSAVLAAGVSNPATAVAALVGVLGVILYVYGYSRFAAPRQTPLRVGAPLPRFELQEAGRAVSSSDLIDRPALWIFYRGNWCPLCMAQVREVAAEYRELARRGVEVFLVSPQPESHTADLAARFDVPMRFMTDRRSAAAAILGIREAGGLPFGLQVLGYDSDVPRPTVLITAAGGALLYCDLTDNYRIRPEPAQFLAVLDRHGVHGAPACEASRAV